MMASFQASGQAQNETCRFTDLECFLHYSLIPSVAIIIVLTCLEKRAKRSPVDEKLPLNRRCGIVVPLDFVGAFKNRWSLGFAFGATANKVMILFSEGYTPLQMAPRWAGAIVLFLGATEVGLSSYPFFACLSTRSQIAGPALGFLYTEAWFVIMNMHIMLCPHGQVAGPYEKVIFYWPSLLCQVFLLVKFAQMFLTASWARLHRGHLKEESSFLEVHQAQYVQRLMRKPQLEQPQKSWIQRKVYEWDPYFHFPSRLINTAMLAIICLYMFVVMEHHVYKLISGKLGNMQMILERFIASSNVSNGSLEDAAVGIQDFAELISITEDVWIFTTFTASLMCVSYTFHILACYRKHMKRLWIGQKLFLPLSCGKPSSSQSVGAIARYSGWQIAYILWGYLIMHTVHCLFGVMFMYGFVLPIKHGQWKQMIDSLGNVILTVVPVMGLMVMQFVIAAKFFLQPKTSQKDKEKPLALDNRKGFHNFNYFLLFYNVLLGLNVCLFRLLSSVFVGTWLVARIDRTIMPKGYEAVDAGFRTWIGMLFVDHYHTNPTLVCFCHVLVVATRSSQLQRTSNYHQFSKVTDYRISRKARTRWLLLYTLLNNPNLTKLRKPKL